jgi:hypothetical protein
VCYALLIGAERIDIHRSQEAGLSMSGSWRSGARPCGAAVMLRWLAWFNGARRPGQVDWAGVCFVRWSMAQDSTTQQGRRVKRSRTSCVVRSHGGSAGNDAAAMVDEGE